MKIRGPILTLAAVAVLGVAILLVNISKEEPPPPEQPAAQTTTATAVAPPPSPATPPPPAFPAKADYVGKIASANGTITVEVTVDGDKAIAYACDGNTVESWLRGSAVNGAVSLENKDKTSRLDGRLQGDAIVGTLSIGAKKWDFTAPIGQPPAGLYVYENAGVRNSWIVDGDGKVTGVQRREDGSTVPAPTLTTEGIADIDGIEVRAIRVEGDSDV
ncbi:hypothetical protein A5724_23890 [Mycobacterium sp. ACS1612]|uniref:hypothetical protein n=1 Tax=Mycobacterium sp. ACS1612 TaxID=1834117 RepID=UPI0007FF7D10|nr:hypothetical protein [Mycobacterium sp. ACS1612]OBF30415.1 hypothetical protein A5724_23890 [Mycobacterium sp. ACS1612]